MLKADVLERVSKCTRAERIAWAVTCAINDWHQTQPLVVMLSAGNSWRYPTIEDLRKDEDRLEAFVRKSATFANYALDQLDDEGHEAVQRAKNAAFAASAGPQRASAPRARGMGSPYDLNAVPRVRR